MRKSEISIVLICFGLIFYAPAFAEDVERIEKSLKEAIHEELAAQKEVQEWSAEKEAIINDLLDLKTRLDWNRFQNRKYKAYVYQKAEEVNDLKTQKEKLASMRMELEPYLSQVVSDLKDRIVSDVPFLDEERSRRITFLEESLLDPSLNLGERLRRVLEALRVEAGYGNSVGIEETKLVLNGEPTLVTMTRVGRVGIFYTTNDRKQAGKWDKVSQSWQPVSDDYLPDILRTTEIIQQKRAAELVDLPIGPTR
ncbi:MAG: hypothetical protein AVO38_13015 [delta proteobacterium ML8_D]|nr:MAG: hypothetical protein AVO38_13015 [delta proteobacterium ML8_D]